MHSVELHFHDKKHAKKLIRNMEKGRGTIIRPEHVVLGGSFLSGLRNFGNSIAHTVAPIAHTVGNIVQPIAQNVAQDVVNSHVGNLLGDVAEAGALGAGMKKGRGRPKKGKGFFGNLAKGALNASKNIAKANAPLISSAVGNLASNTAQNIAQNAINSYAGSGLKRKKGGMAMGSGIIKHKKSGPKSLKLPKDLEIYNRAYSGGSFSGL